MIAIYRGHVVRVVSYATRGDRSQIALRGMLRWVKTCDLELLS
jgi:hypothetical protein